MQETNLIALNEIRMIGNSDSDLKKHFLSETISQRVYLDVLLNESRMAKESQIVLIALLKGSDEVNGLRESMTSTDKQKLKQFLLRNLHWMKMYSAQNGIKKIFNEQDYLELTEALKLGEKKLAPQE